MASNFNPKMEKPKRQEGMVWSNAADGEMHSSEWFGAILRYFWYFGKRKFNTFYNQKELKKNARIGWLFKVIVVVLLLYLGYRYSS
ncbi:MAG TPA: hypothetical protein P5343_10830 [Flavobacteriaceae bacterium]|nr:hypothetical protein [Flavobacteriaceae bacterium]HRW45274.1 hypothetical protein [Flavobacteriaceae bacterium]